MFLEQWFDAKLDIDLTVLPAVYVGEELARIQTAAAQILIAADMPRRLGADATSDDLALDKRRCKRALHVLKAALQAWSEGNTEVVQFRPLTDEDRQKGAQLDWTAWWQEQKLYLENRRAWFATYGLKKPDTAWARKAVTRINNELNHMSYAMR